MNKNKMSSTTTDLDLYFDLNDGSNDRENGAVGGARTKFPGLEGHVDVCILDQCHCSKIICLETQCPVFYRVAKDQFKVGINV